MTEDTKILIGWVGAIAMAIPFVFVVIVAIMAMRTVKKQMEDTFNCPVCNAKDTSCKACDGTGWKQVEPLEAEALK